MAWLQISFQKKACQLKENFERPGNFLVRFFLLGKMRYQGFDGLRKTKVKSQSHQDSYQLSFNQMQISPVKNSHVETDANSKFTFLFKPKNRQSYMLLKFDSGKREIQSLHQSKHPKVWHLLKYCLSVHLQGGVDFGSTGKVAGAVKDGTYPVGLLGVIGVPVIVVPVGPIAPYIPLVVRVGNQT